jgi:protein tyrosine phosphatase
MKTLTKKDIESRYYFIKYITKNNTTDINIHCTFGVGLTVDLNITISVEFLGPFRRLIRHNLNDI